MTKIDEYYFCRNFNLAIKLNGIITEEQYNKIVELLDQTYGKYFEEETNES